ncbi:glucose-6-phosphate dehydrogenase [Mycetocola zhujimingii]|uniref:Glucose-6-phosphate dehydrogenase n=1 Tax=Mycetocola zhujimingii TaxID=2079792 RepID=A0A2U1TCM1_9MICO|nr:glucose-6-phosphate dehydrogenase [Mycetocola zhujimingii]PWC06642.1 glucose-6-phosphate dehydrogenase [Mycetocola zhujimingii]
MTDQPGIPDAESISPDARTIAILGAGGDLTERLLLPGLARVVESARGLDLTLIGAARTAQSDEEWQSLVRRSLEDAGISAQTVDALSKRARFVQTDASDPDELKALLDACPSAPVLYIALPPAMGRRVAEALAAIELPDDLVVAIEKPFGEDLDDARALNEALAAVIPADRLWRIDHFLGNATVLGMLGLRFGNRLLEATWSAEHIEKVEIVYDEVLGLEGRAAFYDQTGALRDMLQSHLLMVLALIAMERPDEITASDVHERMAEVLGVTRIWRDDPTSARRARYTEGRVDGRLFPSYVDEADVDGDREIETLAQLLLQIDTPRWEGVPFVLRSGKAIGNPRAEAAVHFRASTPPAGFRGASADTGTVLRMSLENGDVDLDLFVNGADDAAELRRVTLEARPGEPELDAYAQVLAGILQNDTLLSVRGDIAEQCWRIVTPVLNAWQAGEAPLEEYPAGSSGPDGW